MGAASLAPSLGQRKEMDMVCTAPEHAGFLWLHGSSLCVGFSPFKSPLTWTLLCCWDQPSEMGTARHFMELQPAGHCHKRREMQHAQQWLWVATKLVGGGSARGRFGEGARPGCNPEGNIFAYSFPRPSECWRQIAGLRCHLLYRLLDGICREGGTPAGWPGLA